MCRFCCLERAAPAVLRAAVRFLEARKKVEQRFEAANNRKTVLTSMAVRKKTIPVSVIRIRDPVARAYCLK